MNNEAVQIALTGWQGANIAFWAITAVVLLSACFAALSRSIVQAAFALFFCLLGIAGYYVLLGSAFLAVTQIIIYVGGILVLLMFGILLTNRPLQRDLPYSPGLYGLVCLAGLLLLGVIEAVIGMVPWRQAATLATPASDVRPIGKMLLTKYLLAFELAGVTLLLCLIGAAYLVRRRER
jgi:NADH:ubiquinone oxidoreductase subunit 6 (subunit J)